MNYDLWGRTRKFSKEIISICKNIKYNPVNTNLTSQLIRSSTSIGANYSEANGASSKPNHAPELRTQCKECHELTLIFGKIIASMKTGSKFKN